MLAWMGLLQVVDIGSVRDRVLGLVVYPVLGLVLAWMGLLQVVDIGLAMGSAYFVKLYLIQKEPELYY